MDFSVIAGLSKPKPEKNTKKNAFFFFMRQRKRELESDGLRFPRGYFEVANFVSEEWKEIPKEERQMYVDMAQKHNEEREAAAAPTNAVEMLIVSLNDLKLRTKTNKFSRETGEKHVGELLADAGNDVREIPIVLLNFNVYWGLTNGNGSMAIPAEVGLTVFNLKDGIKDCFSTLIDPGEITTMDSFNYDIKTDVETNTQLMLLPDPDYHEEFQNYSKILQRIQDFVNLHSQYFGEPYVFCLDSELDFADASIDWLCQKSGYKRNIKILSLNSLIQFISQNAESRVEVGRNGSGASNGSCESSVTSSPFDQSELQSALAKKKEILGARVVYPAAIPEIRNGEFKLSSHVEEFLSRRNFAYYGELGCLYHMELDDGIHHCSQNKTNRYAFSLLDALTGNFGVIPRPGQHYPMLKNMEEESVRRRDMLHKWVIGDPSFVVYLQFFKNVDGFGCL